jgi:Ras-related protein M-Ras
MREQYIRTGQGFMLVYSVTDFKSFEFVRSLYQQVLRVKDVKEYPVLLVANKTDLTSLRCVSEQQGRDLADELRIPYIETSAKTPPVNVEGAFHELVRIMKSFQDNDEPIAVSIFLTHLSFSILTPVCVAF